MLIPLYNPRHPEETYKNNSYEWINLSVFLNVLSDEVINDFKDLSAFKLNEIYDGKWDNKINKYSPVSLWWDNFIDFKTFLIASKVFYTTGFTCKYGYWKKWVLTDYGYPHHGIDLILPKWTPINSFSKWEVYSIKEWDGEKKDAWNCIVIKTDNLYFCYEHLDTIDVKKWDKIEKWQNIWTCGKSWNATTFHLHFQIDTDLASFHPYWWKWENDIQKTYSYCVEPWSWLRKNYKKIEATKHQNNEKSNEEENNLVDNILNKLWKNNSTKKENDNVVLASATKKEIIVNNKKNNWKTEKNEPDLIDSLTNNLIWEHQNKWENNYISFFQNAWILKWDHWDLMLDATLTRYQMVLIIYRLKKAGLLSLPEKSCNFYFKDISDLKKVEEFIQALKFVVCNGIIHWDNWYFLPWNKLNWVQFLAIIWRLFGNIKDWKDMWYVPYIGWAENNWYISKNWEFLNKNISREEVFKILYKLFE